MDNQKKPKLTKNAETETQTEDVIIIYKHKHKVTEDVVQEDSQQSQMYAKDSMDRFGDDLCEYILSYLTLSDRFRCECVSKQWRRLIYTTVRELCCRSDMPLELIRYYYHTRGTNLRILLMTTITKKCKNIESIDIENMIYDESDRRALQTIDDLRCHRLRHLRLIKCSLFESNTFADYFYRTFGPLVTEMDLLYDSWRSNIPLCPQLCHLKTLDFSYVFAEPDNELLAKNLRHFDTYFGPDFDNQMFDEFVAHNQSLECLVVRYIPQYIDLKDIVLEFLTRVSQLPQLKQLTLFFCKNEETIQYSIGDSLREIGIKCPKLKLFSLRMCSQTPQLNVDILTAIPFMRQLRRLDLRLHLPDPNGPLTTDWHAFDSMNKWPKGLTHMSLHLWDIHYKLFQQIESNLRRLQSLDISDWKSVINSDSLDCISRLPTLQELVITYTAGYHLDYEIAKRFASNSSPKLSSFIISNTTANTRDLLLHFDAKRIHELRQ